MRPGSFFVRGRWILALSLALGASSALPGCAGKKVKEDFEVRSKASEAEALTRDVDVEPISEGPYHLGLRLGSGALEALIIEAVGPKLAEAGVAGVSGAAGNMGGAAGDIGESIELSPLTLKGVTVDFPGDTPGILRARINIDGRIGVKVKSLIESLKKQAGERGGGGGAAELLNDYLGGSGGMLGDFAGGAGGAGGMILDRLQSRLATDETRWIPFSPEIAVRVYMGAEVVDDRPAMVMELREVESFALGLNTPLQFEALTTLVEEAGRQKIGAMLTDPAANPDVRKVIPLPERAGRGGLPINLESIGLKVVPGTASGAGELFLGIMTNLNVTPGVTADNRGAALGEKGWGLVIDEGTLGLMVRTMSRQGKIPLRFNKRQEIQADGDVVVEPEFIHLGDYGFQLSSRIWNLSAPAFWRRFDIYGNFEVEQGQIKPAIQRIEAGDEGEGNVWLGKMIEKRQEAASKKSMAQAGKATRPTLPLPMTGGKRAMVLNIEEAKTTEGLLTILGGVEIQNATPE